MPQPSLAVFSKSIPKLSALILMADKINCGQCTSTKLLIDKFVDCMVSQFCFFQSLKPKETLKFKLLKAVSYSHSQQHNEKTINKPQINVSGLHIAKPLQNHTLHLLTLTLHNSKE